ncbi:Probable triosephosphate isomerase (TpiA) [Mycobacteroides abscessus]|nr:Probable triosephosphate isomerase (TpiA) [Mycobacteroides abscessus]
MSRKPLIAGNWKMNLNHFEAIALVQKIAFSLPDKYFDKVDVTVIPPFTDIRSVQTLVDGDKLRLTYGAQDLSVYDSGAYTGEVSGPSWPSWVSPMSLSVTPSAASITARMTRWSRPRLPRPSNTASHRSCVSVRHLTSGKPEITSSTT